MWGGGVGREREKEGSTKAIWYLPFSGMHTQCWIKSVPVPVLLASTSSSTPSPSTSAAVAATSSPITKSVALNVPTTFGIACLEEEAADSVPNNVTYPVLSIVADTSDALFFDNPPLEQKRPAACETMTSSM